MRLIGTSKIPLDDVVISIDLLLARPTALPRQVGARWLHHLSASQRWLPPYRGFRPADGARYPVLPRNPRPRSVGNQGWPADAEWRAFGAGAGGPSPAQRPPCWTDPRIRT